MNDWKEIAPYFKEFFNTLAGKLNAGAAFALLILLALAWFGVGIPRDYLPLIYGMVALVLVNALWQPWRIADSARKARLRELERKLAQLESPKPPALTLTEMHTTTVEDGAAALGDANNVLGADAIQIQGDVGGPVVRGDNNQIRYIVNQYAAEQPENRKIALEHQLRNYLNWVIQTYGEIILRGIEQEGRQAVSLPLESVYVPLQAEASAELDNIIPTEQRARETNKIYLNRLLAVGNRLILIGGPGSGKSTVLHHIAWTLAAALQRDQPQLVQEKLGLRDLPLPIYLPLNLFAAYRRDLPKDARAEQKSLLAYVREYLQSRQLDAGFLTELLKQDRAILLLLDGLDEIPNEDDRALIRQAIEDLLAGRKELRAVVTSRVAAYRGAAVLGRGFRTLRVLPLEPEHLKALVEHACRSIYKTSPELAQDKARDLLSDINRLESEREARLGNGYEKFVDSPLMVRLLLIVHFNNRRLPDQRADLYQKAVDAMLKPDYNLDEQVTDELERQIAGSLPLNREILQYVAWHMHQRGKSQGRDIDEDTLKKILQTDAQYAPHTAELLAQTKQRGALLEERGGLYRFIHLSFQEFLVGRYWVETLRDEDKIAAQIENGLAGDPWWREPILLTVGYLDLNSPRSARQLLLRLGGLDDTCTVPDHTLTLDQRLAAAEIAGRAYLECKNQAADLRDKFQARLLSLHACGAREKWQPTIMAAAADLADELGYIPPDLYDFIAIPADAKTPQFWIAKYPVTNAQYARFLRAPNFETYWRDLRGFGAPEDNYPVESIDGRQNIQRQPGYWDDPRFGRTRPHAPVVGVTWYAAAAYANWLTQNWRDLPEGAAFTQQPANLVFRLPKEDEWEHAAGQHPKDVPPKQLRDWQKERYAWNKYPEITSDAAERIRRANYAESQIGRTSVVWQYPQGASAPYGVRDLTGNVWEWQANAYPGEKLARVVRGGSFLDENRNVRCAVRYRNLFSGRYGSRGFRVVVSPCR